MEEGKGTAKAGKLDWFAFGYVIGLYRKRIIGRDKFVRMWEDATKAARIEAKGRQK